MAFTYMLRCADGSYYVGSARNLEQRLEEHGLGMGAAYTRSRLPVQLVWVEEFSNIGDAFNREKQVQNWGRAKREALIEQRYEDLPTLARGYWRGLDTLAALAARPAESKRAYPDR